VCSLSPVETYRKHLAFIIIVVVIIRHLALVSYKVNFTPCSLRNVKLPLQSENKMFDTHPAFSSDSSLLLLSKCVYANKYLILRW